jgi:uncharacterized RDD family membrane protein YckC
MGAPQIIQPSQPTNYAGFWLRFSSALIDAVTLFFPLAIVAAVVVVIVKVVSFRTKHDLATLIIATLPAAWAIAVWCYGSVMESSSWQATIGKKMLRLYVTDVEGCRLTFRRAAGRNLAKYLSSATAGVGYLMCGFTQKKQALHDIVAGCLVLRQQQQAQLVQNIALTPD